MEIAGHQHYSGRRAALAEQPLGEQQIFLGGARSVLQDHVVVGHTVLDQVIRHRRRLGDLLIGSPTATGDQQRGASALGFAAIDLDRPIQARRQQRRHVAVDQPGAVHDDRVHPGTVGQQAVAQRIHQECREQEPDVADRHRQRCQKHHEPEVFGVQGEGEHNIRHQQRDAESERQQIRKTPALPAYQLRAVRDRQPGQHQHHQRRQEHEQRGEHHRQITVGDQADHPRADERRPE